MRRGKEIAQACHAANSSILENISLDNLKNEDPLKIWLSDMFTKVCCFVTSEEQIDNLYKLALDKCKYYSQNNNKYCLVIGPDFNSNLEDITSNLKLY